MNLTLLAEGPGWIVIDKPANCPVHRSSECNERDTVARRLRLQLKRDISLVHRLDRGTSGCLVVAFDGPTATALQTALGDSTAEKRYLAISRGAAPAGSEILVERPLKDDGGTMREASTHFRVLASCPEPRASLILAAPHPGRRHQIRRHLGGLSHPVLGDSTHGDTKANRLFREATGLERLALHCMRITLTLPEALGGTLHALAPLPPELTAPLSRLPMADEAFAALHALSPALWVREPSDG